MTHVRKSWWSATALGMAFAFSYALPGAAQQYEEGQKPEKTPSQGQEQAQGRSAQQRQGQAQESAPDERAEVRAAVEKTKESARALNSDYKLIEEHTRALEEQAKGAERLDKSSASRHVSGLSAPLNAAKRDYTEWREGVQGAPQMMTHIDKLERDHSIMASEYEALQRELDKATPDPKGVASMAKRIREAAKDARDELEDAMS